jgi:cell division initiation protein
MRLTPIEIQRHQFASRLRGFDREEVRAFLEMIVSDFEEIVRENAQLRRETERLMRDLEDCRSKEHTIQETMTTAQGVVEELKHTAMKEAEIIVAAAEVQAEKTLQEAEARRADLSNEITQMQHIRRQIEVELRRTLEGYLSLLDTHQAAQVPADPSPGEPLAEGNPDGG